MRVLSILFCCAACYSVPIGFFAVGFPAVLRDAGVSLALIGLASFVYLPMALAFLWAPWVDRRSLAGPKPRIAMLVGTAGAMAGLTLMMALLDPAMSVAVLLGTAVCIAICAATMRTATLGLAVLALPTDTRPLGAAMLPAGGAVGTLAGATGLLLLYDTLGWTGSVITMAALIVVFALPSLGLTGDASGALRANSGPSLMRLLRRAETRRILFFTVPLASGFGLGFGMVQPRLVDLGFTMTQIGVLNGTLSVATLVAGGALSAWAMRRYGLPQLMPLALLAVVSAFLYAAAVAALEPGRVQALISIGVAFAAMSFASVLMNVLFMEHTASGSEGTGFTLFICFFWLMTVIGLAASGVVGQAYGYAAVYAAAALLCAAAWPLWNVKKNGASIARS